MHEIIWVSNSSVMVNVTVAPGHLPYLYMVGIQSNILFWKITELAGWMYLIKGFIGVGPGHPHLHIHSGKSFIMTMTCFNNIVGWKYWIYNDGLLNSPVVFYVNFIFIFWQQSPSFVLQMSILKYTIARKTAILLSSNILFIFVIQPFNVSINICFVFPCLSSICLTQGTLFIPPLLLFPINFLIVLISDLLIPADLSSCVFLF